MPETVVLDVPSLLNAAAVFVAILAAVYAGWSARASRRQAAAAEAAVAVAVRQSELAKDAVSEARSQNRIAIHNECLKIYKALLTFRGTVSANGVHFKDDAIWGFWEHAQLAEFYFSEHVAKELSAIVGLAFDMKTSRSRWDEDADFKPEDKPRLVRHTNELLHQLRDRIEKLHDPIRYELRLVEG